MQEEMNNHSEEPLCKGRLFMFLGKHANKFRSIYLQTVKNVV